MKIVSVIGTRPQFIKVAPICRAIEKHSFIEHVIIDTGQHYDKNMSSDFIAELGIPEPKHTLHSIQTTPEHYIGSHAYQIASILIYIEETLQKEQPDVVLVYGDTNSALGGALAASKLNMKLAHIESGIRSFNGTMPEETNRIIIDNLSDILFAPTATAVKNLYEEGIKRNVYNVGDVMFDAFLNSKPLTEFSTKLPDNFILATLHRTKAHEGMVLLNELHHTVVLPLHPGTLEKLHDDGFKPSMYPNVKFIEPVSYKEMMYLLTNCLLLITDSGGLQKEAYFVGKPCITLRNDTEWPETVSGGENILTGVNLEKILQAIEYFTNHEPKKKYGPNYWGNGEASERIIHQLLNC